jgi:hypothetical protein
MDMGEDPEPMWPEEESRSGKQTSRLLRQEKIAKNDHECEKQRREAQLLLRRVSAYRWTLMEVLKVRRKELDISSNQLLIGKGKVG